MSEDPVEREYLQAIQAAERRQDTNRAHELSIRLQQYRRSYQA